MAVGQKTTRNRAADARHSARRRGEEHDYARIVEQHRAELEAHSRRILRSGYDAEDAVQEALLKAWRALPSFEGRGSLRGWLYRIVTNASLDQMHRRPERVEPIEDELPAGGIETDPAGRYERREETERALATAERILTEKQRDVLISREALGFSAEETAKRLGMSVAAVNSALQRARATIDERADARAA